MVVKDNKIIATIGVIGSGKDYYCNQLNPDCKIGFSDGVREYTWAALGWAPKDDFEYEYFKTSKILAFIKTVGIKDMEGRQLLENIATKLREYDNYFWAKVWRQKASSYLKANEGVVLVAHDCRYPEEAYHILATAAETRTDVQFIFLDYKSPKYQIRDHESEAFAQYFLNEGCTHQQDITKKVKQKLYETSKI